MTLVVFALIFKIKKLEREDHKSEAKMGSIYFIENAGEEMDPLLEFCMYYLHIGSISVSCGEAVHSSVI